LKLSGARPESMEVLRAEGCSAVEYSIARGRLTPGDAKRVKILLELVDWRCGGGELAERCLAPADIARLDAALGEPSFAQWAKGKPQSLAFAVLNEVAKLKNLEATEPNPAETARAPLKQARKELKGWLLKTYPIRTRERETEEGC
jgi:hypothetical protein